jgi:hypothetical protein
MEFEASPTRPSPRALPIAGIVTGAVIAFVAAALLLGGGGLLWASTAKTDDSGWWNTSAHRYATPTGALATEDLDLRTGVPDRLVSSDHLADVRVSAAGAKPVFVGIARTARVDAYLRGVAHDELADLDFDPFTSRLQRRSGQRHPAAPATLGFWVASATGSGRQTVTWPVRSGRWSVVVMNADASPGVSVDIRAGARVPFVHDLAVVLLIVGGVLGLGSAALIALGTVGLRRSADAPRQTAVGV